MIHDTYTFQDLSEVCYHLSKYKNVKEEWRADFCNIYGELVASFDSDEETMERLKDPGRNIRHGDRTDGYCHDDGENMVISPFQTP